MESPESSLESKPLARGPLGAPGLIVLALVAGGLAGGAAWAVGEMTLFAFEPPSVESSMMGQKVLKVTFEDQAAADLKNATLAYAELGGLLGLALGVAGGLARRSFKAAALAGVVGLILGAGLTVASSLVALPYYFKAKDANPEELSLDITLPLLVHAGSWVAVGLAGGLALGLGRGGGVSAVVKATLGGVVGALVGAVAYEILGATFFPAGRTTDPVSTTWHTRLLARLSVALFVSLLAAAVARMRTSHAQAKPAPLASE